MTNVQNISECLSDRVKIVDFPYYVFPKRIREIMDQYHSTLGFNYDFMGGAVLYSTSLAFGNTIRIQVKNKWIESATIWICIVGKAGINKSAPIAAWLEPLRCRDKKYFEEYKNEIANYNQYLQVNSKKSKKKDDEIENKYREPPKRRQFLLSDFTPEALCEAHSINKYGIGIYSDELLQWLSNIGRYIKSGEEQFYLSSWSGREVNINRRSQPHIFIDNPFINIIGGIQPSKISEAFGKGRQSSGFTHRMLFAFPNKILREDFTDTEIADIYLDTYNEYINNLIAQTLKYENKIVTYTSAAQHGFKTWRHINNQRINEQDDGDITGIYAKLEIYLIRISLILQIMNDSLNNKETFSVDIEAFNGAIELTNYFENTALKVNNLIRRFNDPLNNYSMDKRIVYTALPTDFTTMKGEEISKQLNMPRRTFFEFLDDDYLFIKLKHGHYQKKI
jgi:hypothetical protein